MKSDYQEGGLSLAHFPFQLVKAKTKHKTSQCGSAGKGEVHGASQVQVLWVPTSWRWINPPGLHLGLYDPAFIAAAFLQSQGLRISVDFSPLSWGEHHPEHLCCQLCLPLTFAATKHRAHSPYENAIKANQRGSFVPQHSICLYCFSGSLELQECPAVPSIILVLRRCSTCVLVSFPFNFLYHLNQNCVL